MSQAEDKRKEPCTMARFLEEADNKQRLVGRCDSTKQFIRMKKVFHGMKRDGLPDLFEIAKKKVIRNQKK